MHACNAEFIEYWGGTPPPPLPLTEPLPLPLLLPPRIYYTLRFNFPFSSSAVREGKTKPIFGKTPDSHKFMIYFCKIPIPSDCKIIKQNITKKRLLVSIRLVINSIGL